MHTGTISSGGGNSLVLREEMRLDGRRMKAQFWGSRGPKKAVYIYIYKERNTIISILQHITSILHSHGSCMY